MSHNITSFFIGNLRKQLIVGISLITSLMMALFVWQVTQRHQADMITANTNRAIALSQNISLSASTWLASRDYSALQEIIQGLSGYPDLDYAIVLDLQGQIVAHDSTQYVGRYLHDTPTEIKLSYSEKTKGSVDVFNPIFLGKQPIGWVRIGINQNTLTDDIAQTQRDGMIYTFIAILISLLFANMTGRYLTRRLNLIQDVTNAVQAGRSDARIQMEGEDEAALLAQQINKMLDGLHVRERKIHQLAFFDQLTGLSNRAFLLEQLDAALNKAKQSKQNGAIIFLDLDFFKTLNDTLGHDIGDMLLIQVSERINGCLLHHSIAARLGGDEFVLLIEALSSDTQQASEEAQNMAKNVLQSLTQTYQLNVHEYNITASIGIALFNGATESRENLLKQADIAMYQAKKMGRNNYRVFDQHMQDELNAAADLEKQLGKAIVAEEFKLHYQCQVDAQNNIIGAEVLIRWYHPERGVIPPIQFIPIAEETGMIIEIGNWVLSQACAQLHAWQKNPKTQHLSLAVNVSAKQFFQVDFIPRVEALVNTYHIDPKHLKLELTESIFLDKLNEIIDIMNTLKKIGIRFSLDDFGTGYSSLQYLKQLPLYQLKIDQSFVRDISIDHSDKIIVKTIIAMAKALDLNVIAEGVETEEQRSMLLANGCYNYQGYLFSKPVTLEAFEQLL